MGGSPIFFCGNESAMADLQGLIEQTVTGLGYELVDVESSPRARLLKVFIDKPPADIAVRSGVTVDDCAAVSHQLSRVFLVENIDYDRLEVSSPGMDRPLKKLSDWTRFAGQEVQIKLRLPEMGTTGASSPQQRNFSGVILGCDGESVRIGIAEAERSFALDNIEKARLVPKF